MGFPVEARKLTARAKAAIKVKLEREAAASAAAAAAANAAEEGDDESEDETCGTSRPRHAVLWSHKVKCEAGRRCYAQYGDDADELWFRATISAVHRDEIGQWVDVAYDDGDTEEMKPIKRVRPYESSSESDSDG